MPINTALETSILPIAFGNSGQLLVFLFFIYQIHWQWQNKYFMLNNDKTSTTLGQEVAENVLEDVHVRAG